MTTEKLVKAIGVLDRKVEKLKEARLLHGRDGEPGAAGVPGEQGAKGDDGRDGANGADGRDGRDGISASAEDVAALVQSRIRIPEDGMTPDLAEVAALVPAGQEGPTGPAGPQGNQGSPGPKGDKGDPGKDGASITGVEVRDNKLFVEIDGKRRSAGALKFSAPGAFTPTLLGGGSSIRPITPPALTGVQSVVIGEFETITTQDPTGLGDAGKITANYGPGGSTSGLEFTVGANGVIVANAASAGREYRFLFSFRLGRTGAAGISRMLLRFMYAPDGVAGNAVQLGGTFGVEIDDANSIWREVFDLNFTAAVGAVAFVQIARNPGSDDSGGLLGFQPAGDLSSWSPVATARVTISRVDLV